MDADADSMEDKETGVAGTRTIQISIVSKEDERKENACSGQGRNRKIQQ